MVEDVLNTKFGRSGKRCTKDTKTYHGYLFILLTVLLKPA